MADEEVFMDIPLVEKMSKTFIKFGEILEAVDKALKAASVALKVSAMFSLGATQAAVAYVDRIEPKVKKAKEEMYTLAGDIDGAIRAYRDGDHQGSQRFV